MTFMNIKQLLTALILVTLPSAAGAQGVENNIKMTQSKENFNNHFGFGGENTLYGANFTGKSFFNPLMEAGDPAIRIANVTFEPGGRTNWHIHTASKGGGQILIIADGEGWLQEEGKEAQELLPGMIVFIPAGVKHWHGAKADKWFAHLSLDVPGENLSDEWCEPVTDEEYNEQQDK